jgi:hypothetical protein
MLQEAQRRTKAPFISEKNTMIQTTLYDLIEMVNETVKPGEDQLVAEIVMDLLYFCHAKFRNA